MATPVPLSLQNGTVNFRRNASLLGGRIGVDIEINAVADLEILKALTDNTRLPLTKDPIRLGSVNFSLASSEQTLSFNAGVW